MPRKADIYGRTFFILLSLNILASVVIFTPATNYLYALLEVKSEVKKSDALILLSSESYTDEILGRNSYQRLFHAFRLYREGYTEKLIICGGTHSGGRLPISEVMKGILVEIGVPNDDIITETGSRNTYENIKSLLPLLQSMKIRRPILVTSSYHMFRSVAVCKKLGIVVYPAPVPCYEKDISYSGLRPRFIREILREYAVIIYFWLRGWI